jgi:hypothetical protein
MTSAAQRLHQRRQASLLRPAVDMADMFEDILDQGPRPTCVAVALADAHGRATSPAFTAAIEPLWWDLHQRGETSIRGVTVQAAGEALGRTGHCNDSVWPYNTSLGYGSESPPAAAGQPPWRCAGLLPVHVCQDGVEDDIEDALAAGSPVLLVIEVTDGFDNPEPDAYIPIPSLRAPSGGYHAVLAVGAWTDPQHGRVLLVRNSWGERWGAGGYGLLPLEYLIAHAQDAAWRIG